MARKMSIATTWIVHRFVFYFKHPNVIVSGAVSDHSKSYLCTHVCSERQPLSVRLWTTRNLNDINTNVSNKPRKQCLDGGSYCIHIYIYIYNIFRVIPRKSNRISFAIRNKTIVRCVLPITAIVRFHIQVQLIAYVPRTRTAYRGGGVETVRRRSRGAPRRQFRYGRALRVGPFRRSTTEKSAAPDSTGVQVGGQIILWHSTHIYVISSLNVFVEKTNWFPWGRLIRHCPSYRYYCFWYVTTLKVCVIYQTNSVTPHLMTLVENCCCSEVV